MKNKIGTLFVFCCLLFSSTLLAQPETPAGWIKKVTALSTPCNPSQVVYYLGSYKRCTSLGAWEDWGASAGGLGGSGTLNFLPIWTSSSAFGNSLFVQGTNLIEQKNGTNPQTFYVYETTANTGTVAQIKSLSSTNSVRMGSRQLGLGANARTFEFGYEQRDGTFLGWAVDPSGNLNGASGSQVFHVGNTVPATDIKLGSASAGTGAVKLQGFGGGILTLTVPDSFSAYSLTLPSANVAGVLYNNGSGISSYAPIKYSSNDVFLATANGNVSIGTNTDTPIPPNEILHMGSSTKGFMPPKGSTTARDAISGPLEGLHFYNITTHQPNFYNGTSWTTMGIDGSIGNTQVAFGNGTAIAGDANFTFDPTTHNIAAGEGNTIGGSGGSNIAAGQSNTIGGSGGNSTAIGFNNTINSGGGGTVVIGSNSGDDPTLENSGNNFYFGVSNTVLGPNDIRNSFLVGNQNTINTPNGPVDGSYVFGDGNSAADFNRIYAFGNSNSLTGGSDIFAFGESNAASGTGGLSDVVMIGIGNGNYSLVDNRQRNTQESFALGSQNHLLHSNIALLGLNLSSLEDDSVSLGVSPVPEMNIDSARVFPGADGTINLGSDDTPVAASLTTSLGVSNADLVFTADTAGQGGNAITIWYKDPAAINQSLGIQVFGNFIEVDLATNGTGAITSTATSILTAVNANVNAGPLVNVTNAPGNNGSGIVTAMPTTALEGGISKHRWNKAHLMSTVLHGATSGALTHTVPTTVTPYTLTWPSATANGFIKNASGALSFSQPSLTADVTGTLPVANGGTGVASTTAYALLAGGTTSTGAFQPLAGLGTAGQMLVSSGAGALPAFSNTIISPVIRGLTVVTLTDAATIATDASLANHFRVTLAGNRTLGNPTSATDGQKVVWEVIQDGTGSRTLAFDTQFAFGSDITACTVSVTASKRDFIGAIYNSTTTKWYVTSCVKGY